MIGTLISELFKGKGLYLSIPTLALIIGTTIWSYDKYDTWQDEYNALIKSNSGKMDTAQANRILDILTNIQDRQKEMKHNLKKSLAKQGLFYTEFGEVDFTIDTTK